MSLADLLSQDRLLAAQQAAAIKRRNAALEAWLSSLLSLRCWCGRRVK